MGFTVHLLRLLAHCDYFPARAFDGNNRWFIDHDFVVVNDNRIGRSEVNRDLLGEKIE
jgi:hypothetical protein